MHGATFVSLLDHDLKLLHHFIPGALGAPEESQNTLLAERWKMHTQSNKNSYNIIYTVIHAV